MKVQYTIYGKNDRVMVKTSWYEIKGNPEKKVLEEFREELDEMLDDVVGAVRYEFNWK